MKLEWIWVAAMSLLLNSQTQSSRSALDDPTGKSPVSPQIPVVTQVGPTDCLSYRLEENGEGEFTVTCVLGGGGTGFPTPGGGGGGGGGSVPTPGGGGGSGGSSRPGLPLKPEHTLLVNAATSRAIEKLADPQCSALFSPYTQPFNNALFILQDWLLGYRSGDSGSGCAGVVAAHTPIAANPAEIFHSRWIVICDGFSHLSQGEAANRIIHEALHVAGHRERPPDSTGKTTTEIDQMVREACGS